MCRKNISQRNNNGSEVGDCEAYSSLGIVRCTWRRMSKGDSNQNGDQRTSLGSAHQELLLFAQYNGKP